MRSDNWNPDDENWNWVNYFSIQLGPDGTWEGDIYLKLKETPPEGSYLKAKVREADDSDTFHEQKIENLEISDDWGFVEGYATNGEEPYIGEIIEVVSGNNLIAANFTATAPWDDEGEPGWFVMPVPAGEYVLQMRDYPEQASIVITNGETTTQNLGSSNITEMISITEYSRTVNSDRGLIYTEVIIVGESPMVEYDIEYSIWDEDTDIGAMWNGEEWINNNKRKTVTTDEDGKATMETLLNVFSHGSSTEYNLTTELFNSDEESVSIAYRVIERNTKFGWLTGKLGDGNETIEIFVLSDDDLNAFSYVEPFPWGDGGSNVFNISLKPGEYTIKIPGVIERQVEIFEDTETEIDLTAKVPDPEIKLNYPDATYNGIGTIIPFDVDFRGLPAINYEVKAWFYGNGRVQSSFWNIDDWSSNLGPYMPIDTNETAQWNGSLMVRIEDKLVSDSYFKVRFRNMDNKQDYYDLKIFPENVTTDWCIVEGYIGEDFEPKGNVWIRAYTEGKIFTANISLPNKWSTDNRWGYYSLALPPGEYIISWMDNTEELTINDQKNITLNLGYEPKKSIENDIIIEWIYYDPWLTGEADEAICLINQGATVDVGGWAIGDLKTSYYLPWETLLEGGERMIISLNSTAFFESHRYWPDFKMIEDGSDVPLVNGETVYLSNNGDAVIVKDHNGILIDSVAYGDSEIPEGWEGGAASTVTEGRYLHRNNENNDEYVDTDTTLDWKSFRHYRPGQTSYIGEEMTADSIVAFTSPESTFWIVKQEIDNATQTIDLSLYYLNHSFLVDALANALDRGVKVRVLLEGAPVAGFKDSYKYRAQTLQKAGAEVHLMKKTEDATTRYPYLHAKYSIIDSKKTIIMSENWGLTGISIDGYGNRGWGVVVESEEVAESLTTIFESDFSLKYGDVIVFEESTDYSETEENRNTGCCNGIDPLIITNPTNIRLAITPDNSLSENTIIGLIRNSESEIIIQQHNFAAWWTEGDNPYLMEIIKAAERGVNVTIMFDGTQQEVAENNQYAYLVLKEIENSVENIELKIYRDDEFIRIHNKGMIVDQKWTLISSINWGIGGGALNREVGIIIESEEIATFYRDIFWDDWEGREEVIEHEKEEKSDEDEKLTSLSIPLIIVAIVLVSCSRLLNRNRLS